MDDMNTLIQAVAKRHGVILGKDDPVLMLQTFLEYAQKNLAECQEEERNKLVGVLELEQLKWSEESRARSERIINASLDHARQQATEVCECAAAALMRRIEETLSAKIAQVEQKQLVVYRLAMLNAVGAGLVATGGLFVWLAQ